jgi:hypothetical protein
MFCPVGGEQCFINRRWALPSLMVCENVNDASLTTSMAENSTGRVASRTGLHLDENNLPSTGFDLVFVNCVWRLLIGKRRR